MLSKREFYLMKFLRVITLILTVVLLLSLFHAIPIPPSKFVCILMVFYGIQLPFSLPFIIYRGGLATFVVNRLGHTEIYEGPHWVILWKNMAISIVEEKFEVNTIKEYLNRPTCCTLLEQRYFHLSATDIQALEPTISNTGEMTLPYRNYPLPNTDGLVADIEEILSLRGRSHVVSDAIDDDRVISVMIPAFSYSMTTHMDRIEYAHHDPSFTISLSPFRTEQIQTYRKPWGSYAQVLLPPAIMFDVCTFPVQGIVMLILLYKGLTWSGSG